MIESIVVGFLLILVSSLLILSTEGEDNELFRD